MIKWPEIILNRDSLLITIGDSWTRGVGCYIPSFLELYNKNKISYDELDRRCRINESYSNGSWPTQISRMFDCDLINLGRGGDSNSVSAKRLIQDCHDMIFARAKNYKKVSVIWLISTPDRLGFYSDKTLCSFPLAKPSKIVKTYLKNIHKHPLDTCLETSFYLRTVEWYCKANNYSFIYGSAWHPISDLNTIYDSECNIHKHISVDSISKFLDVNKDQWSHCGHPNENGYRVIAEKLYKSINEYFPDFL